MKTRVREDDERRMEEKRGGRSEGDIRSGYDQVIGQEVERGQVAEQRVQLHPLALCGALRAFPSPGRLLMLVHAA